MSEIFFWVAICVVPVAALFVAARNARREPKGKARKNDGGGDAGGVYAGDSGDCGGGDGGGD